MIYAFVYFNCNGNEYPCYRNRRIGLHAIDDERKVVQYAQAKDFYESELEPFDDEILMRFKSYIAKLDDFSDVLSIIPIRYFGVMNHQKTTRNADDDQFERLKKECGSNKKLKGE